MKKQTTGQAYDFYEARYAQERQSLREVVFSEVYDDYFGQSSWIATADYDRLPGLLEIGRDARVLDVACGAGAPAVRLARHTGCALVGIDNNAQAIATATALTQEHGLGERVEFVQHDANQELPFSNDSFDAAICIDAIAMLPDRLHILGECARVLKPGGRLLFTDPALTGPISNIEMALRTPFKFFLFVPAGYNELLLGQLGFDLLRREDLTATLAGIASRHRVARAKHTDALRAIEGDEEFEMQSLYRAVAEQLYLERRLSHFLFVAQKGGCF
jgi:SAM-dependent methyltransferase